MTRFLVAALAALAVLPAARAQSPTFGLKAGLNVSDFSGDNAPNSDPRLGFAGGLTVDVPLGPGFSLRPELLYTMKGGVGEGVADATLSVDYLEVPLLAAFTAPVTDSGLLLGAYAGPALAFKVREELEGTLGGLPPEVFNSTDIGAAVGLTVGAGPFALDGRYTVGLTDATEDLEIRNNVFTISGVYRFGR